jgi:ABC-2 type transport system permease protein
LIAMNAFMMLVRKDLRLYLSNRRALLMNLAAPILIAAFFGAAFGGSSDSKTSPLPIGVTDQDQSSVSKRIVEAMRADASIEVIELTAEDGQDRVRNGKLGATLVFPAGFGAAAVQALFGGGDKPQVTMRYDPSKTAVPAMAKGLLTEHAMQSVMTELTSSPVGGDALKADRERVEHDSTLDQKRRADLVRMFDGILAVVPSSDSPSSEASRSGTSAGPGLATPFTLDSKAETTGDQTEYNGYAHAFAGMGVQFILFMGIDLGVGILTARKLGLWNRMKAAPISSATLYGSRLLSGAVIAAALMACIYAAGMAVFGVRVEGSVLGFVLVLLSFAVMTASFGMLIAALGNTPEATRGLAIFVTLMLVMLGGAWVPSFIFPTWLQSASLFVPTRWAIDGLEAMTWRGLGLQAALAPVAVMLGFSLVFGVLATWRLAKE